MYLVFYSWQSDDPRGQIIKTIVRNAVEKLKNQGLDLQLKEDSRTINGAEDIAAGIQKEIDECHLFIADLTPVSALGSKLMPNSNVMYESGYAVKTLGDGRCRFLACLDADETIEHLPFDVNHRKLQSLKQVKFPGSPVKLNSWVKQAAESPEAKTLQGALQKWIKDKIDKIKEEETSKIPEKGIAVFLNEGKTETVVSPVYTMKMPRATAVVSPSSGRDRNSVARSIVSGNTADIINAMIANRERIVQPAVIKPIRKEIDHSMVEIAPILYNYGETCQKNINVSIWTDNPSTTLADTNIEERGSFPKSFLSCQLGVHKDKKTASATVETVNPLTLFGLGKIFVKIPAGVTDEQLNWSLNTENFQNQGTLTLKVKPVYVDEEGKQATAPAVPTSAIPYIECQ